MSGRENRINQSAVMCNMSPMGVHMLLHACTSKNGAVVFVLVVSKNKFITSLTVDSNHAYARWALLSPHHSHMTSLQTFPVTNFLATTDSTAR